jgi:hypothetical protein
MIYEHKTYSLKGVRGLENLFSGLIASKTRIKLLIRLFFNPETASYLRELAKEFNVSTNLVREELNQLTQTRLLSSERSGRQVFYRANKAHPLFPELKSMVGKAMGIDQVIDSVVNRLGDLEKNGGGGAIFLGVEDDGRIVGLKDPDRDFQALTNICRDRCIPPISPVRNGRLL